MKKFLSTFLLGSTLVLAACGGGGDSADNSDDSSTDEAHPGEQVAKQNCSSCHGADFTGASGPALAGTSLSEDEFTDIVKNGKGGMPAFGSLSDEEVSDLYDYFTK
uniref:c-type cytochrome n=1 Tax=Nosocomiicoccus ampullae TaxID=489910 RepID=UPI0008335F84|nr:cytochrome c [Nosocomiicoccus ampullae]